MALPKMNTSSQYAPKVGDAITIDLPDERTRGVIQKVISPTAVIAKLSTFTTGVGRSHDYRKDDLVACRYEEQEIGPKGWKAVPERELAQAPEPVAKKSRKRARA